MQQVSNEHHDKTFSSIKRGFNFIKKTDDVSFEHLNGVFYSALNTKKFLLIASALNFISAFCILLASMFFLNKPDITFYATTPSGKVILLERLEN